MRLSLEVNCLICDTVLASWRSAARSTRVADWRQHTLVLAAKAAGLATQVRPHLVEHHVAQLGKHGVARVEVRLDRLVAALLCKDRRRQLHHVWDMLNASKCLWMVRKLLLMPQTSSIRPSYVSCEHMGVMRSAARSTMISDSNSGVVRAWELCSRRSRTRLSASTCACVSGNHRRSASQRAPCRPCRRCGG